MTARMTTTGSNPKGGPWYRRLLTDPLLEQLKQGITPDEVALTMAVGFMIGTFPVLGTTTVLCLLVGPLLKLNQPVLQIVNHSTYPLQLIGIPLFIRLGEWLYSAPPVPFSVLQMVEKFRKAPVSFFHHFAWTFVHCITAWFIVAPVMGLAIFLVARPLLRSSAAKLQS